MLFDIVICVVLSQTNFSILMFLNSSFCRPLEKIVMLDNYSFSFTTVDNVTPSLVGYYTFNDVNATTLNDHADEDNNQKFTKIIRDFNNYVKRDKRTEQIILPIGDGFTICNKL